ncbi:Zinc finger, CCHC-type [Sesbania bispinosa]|nr:Zinc finger, CCHC-type [Sesbania bispinosa]
MATHDESVASVRRPQSQRPPLGDQPLIVLYDDEDVSEGIKSCNRSLVGKILTQKPIHLNSLHNALSGMWCNPRGLRVEEVAPKTFQFFFEEEGDAIRILKGSPWLFRNSWKLMYLKLENEVDFQYERLPQFCYSCGLIGHDEDQCKQHKADQNSDDSREKEFGPWLRASLVGRKATSSPNNNHRKHRENRGPRKKTAFSNELIEKLSSMSVHTDSLEKKGDTETEQVDPFVSGVGAVASEEGEHVLIEEKIDQIGLKPNNNIIMPPNHKELNKEVKMEED